MCYHDAGELQKKKVPFFSSPGTHRRQMNRCGVLCVLKYFVLLLFAHLSPLPRRFPPSSFSNVENSGLPSRKRVIYKRPLGLSKRPLRALFVGIVLVQRLSSAARFRLVVHRASVAVFLVALKHFNILVRTSHPFLDCKDSIEAERERAFS